MENKERYFVFDLDNCLAKDDWRRWMICDSLTGDQRFHEYHMNSVRDQPNKKAAHILNCAAGAGMKIAIITARPERYRVMTAGWLSSVRLRCDTLLMRPDGDKRPSPKLKLDLAAESIGLQNIVRAFDDRDDVVEAWVQAGVDARKLICGEEYEPLKDEVAARLEYLCAPIAQGHLKLEPPQPGNSIGQHVAQLMEEGASTFRERNASYGSNFRMVGPVMQILFPEGAPPDLLRHNAFHLFELIVVKLSRFAVSNFKHQDSIHDAMVYAAMIEAIIQEQAQNASEQ